MIKRFTWKLSLVTFLVATGTVSAGGNLLSNGSFDDPDDPLKGWRYKYDLPGETQWYGNNHTYIDVVPRESGRSNVLRMFGTRRVVFDVGQGVKVDSEPVPFEYGGKYRLSMYVRSEGAGNRIYIIGYAWKPGIKPHPNPKLYELRKVYKGKLLFSVPNTGSAFRRWKKGTGTFPGDDLSTAALNHLKRVRFINVHIVQILCSSNYKEGYFYVDDVELVRER